MKKLLYFFLTAICMVSLLSCSQDIVQGASIDFPQESDTMWNIDQMSFNTIVGFNSAKGWTASVTQGADWCEVTPAKGDGGSAKIYFEVKQNTEPDQRTAVITLASDEVAKTITVVQSGTKARISTTVSEYFCPDDGLELVIDVTSNVPFSSQASDSWIVADASGSTSSSLKFNVAANDGTQERSGRIRFYNSDYDVEKIVTVTQSGKKTEGSIRLLAIGNSFSDDALEYLYQILQQAGYTSIKLGNLYIGGCTLATHASNLASKARNYQYRVNTDGTWNTIPSYSSYDAIRGENWDYISMQQASGSSGMPATYDPHLANLIAGVKELRPEARLMWHMTWAYQQTSTHSEFSNYGKDQLQMYNAIVSTVQDKIVGNQDIEFVIPAGTAIQNLRTSLIGDRLTRDGYHLSNDLGRFTAGLMWAKQISGCDLASISYLPAGFLITQRQQEAIKEAVDNAFKTPFAITESTILDDAEDPNASLEAVLRAGGYRPSDYEQLQFDLIHPGYYNSNASDKAMTVQTNMKNFATTRVFAKSEFPDGTLIVIKEGFGYRPEGWVAEHQKNDTRPDNTSVQITEVSSQWWGDFNFRAFNIFKSGAGDLAPILDEVREGFGIFVPKPAPSNPELEAILTANGYDPGKYRLLRIEVTNYRYYNSSDPNMLSVPGTNMTNFAATEILPKSMIPNGSLIVVKDGYQYRPEGWSSLDAVTSPRPGNVTESIVIVDDSWWREFNWRGFNLAEKNNPGLDDARQAVLKDSFGIFVPIE